MKLQHIESICIVVNHQHAQAIEFPGAAWSPAHREALCTLALEASGSGCAFRRHPLATGKSTLNVEPCPLPGLEAETATAVHFDQIAYDGQTQTRRHRISRVEVLSACRNRSKT